MGIDRSANIKPSEAKRFNTKDILIHFINLLNPENKKLNKHTQASLAALGNTIAQLGIKSENPVPRIIEALEMYLGTPARGSKGMEALSQLHDLKNNYLPNLTIQQEELKKIRATLITQYQLIVAKGTHLDEARVKNLKAELERLKSSKWQNYIEQKENAINLLAPIQEVVEKMSEKGPVAVADHEEIAPATPKPTPPSSSTPAPS